MTSDLHGRTTTWWFTSCTSISNSFPLQGMEKLLLWSHLIFGLASGRPATCTDPPPDDDLHPGQAFLTAFPRKVWDYFIYFPPIGCRIFDRNFPSKKEYSDQNAQFRSKYLFSQWNCDGNLRSKKCGTQIEMKRWNCDSKFHSQFSIAIALEIAILRSQIAIVRPPSNVATDILRKGEAM